MTDFSHHIPRKVPTNNDMPVSSQFVVQVNANTLSHLILSAVEEIGFVHGLEDDSSQIIIDIGRFKLGLCTLRVPDGSLHGGGCNTALKKPKVMLTTLVLIKFSSTNGVCGATIGAGVHPIYRSGSTHAA